ncbi:kinase [Streptococcus sp. sy018]|uniref:class III lanthionine synthetase LanKC N-terminal domain-containing protein n=1 Tax=Streptococcus sp. sy018 TaxID=2600147 RepID=UPI0011B7A806|nr:kinase [Streptococcus sp. sy018]TWS95278.1 kinase [Streptococcus sp. sy018]
MVKIKDFNYHNEFSYDLPTFGFKIHLSGTINNYYELFSLVSPYLINQGIIFKYLNTFEAIEENFSERESYSESGKYITIYPKNKRHCEQILEELYNLIPQKMEGIYIVSDRPYKNSQVIFYRFGSILLDNANFENGLPTLTGPNNQKWQDYQKNYFDLPTWIEDIQCKQMFQSSYLGEHYQVSSILKQSAGGNVYLATNKFSFNQVIIKESRPHILSNGKITKQNLREHEWLLSKKIDKFIPKSIEQTKEWINNYHIYEYIFGTDLLEFSNKYSLFAYKKETSDINYQKFIKLINCFYNLLKCVEYFHKQNIIINDIHPNNFIVDKNLKVTFIDLENSYIYDKSPLVGVYSEISLIEWNSLDGKVADCHKIGNLMLYLLGRLHIRSNNTYKPDILKKLLLQKNIKTNLAEIIDFLFSQSVTITKTIELFENIEIEVNNSIEYNFDMDCIDDLEYLNIVEVISWQKNLIEKYIPLLEDTSSLIKILKEEPKLGLDGVAGIIVYLNYIAYDKSVIEAGIDYILDALVEVDGVKGVKISKVAVSPYLANGTAGIIQMLRLVDFNKYREIIIQLAEGLLIEYAQFPDLWNGMLGIAYTLLYLFDKTHNVTYLNKAKELLINSGILSEQNESLRKEFIYVLSYYKKVTSHHDCQ